MSIKLSDLKKNKIRREIVFTNKQGEKEVIIVKNPYDDSKIKLIEFLSERIKENESELTINPKDIIINLLPLLTNIEVDTEEMDMIISNPNAQLTEVFYHLGEIIQETINEILMVQSSKLSMVSQNSVMEDIQNKMEIAKKETPKKKARSKAN